MHQIQDFGEGNRIRWNYLQGPQGPVKQFLLIKGFFEQVRGSYSFSHFTCQETANYIVGDTRSIQGLVNQHLHDSQWREV